MESNYYQMEEYDTMDIVSNYTTNQKNEEEINVVESANLNTNDNSNSNNVFTKIDLLEINNGWNDNNEKIIVSIGENAASYKWMHDKSAQIYSTLHKVLGFILVMINTGLSAQTLLPENSNIQAIVILRQIFIYIVTFVSVIQNFLKYEELKMKHIEKSSKFSELYHKIQQQMSMYRQNRNNANHLISDTLKEYDSLVVGGPDIHFYALSQFKKIFAKSDFSIPDIADKIQRIEIITETPKIEQQKGGFNTKQIQINNTLNQRREKERSNLNVMKHCFRIHGDITDDDLQKLNDIELQELKRRIGNEKRMYELQRYQNHLNEA